MTSQPPTTVLIDSAHAGERVDEALASLMEVSVQAIKRLCQDGRVTRNHTRLKKGDRVRTGDVVHVLPTETNTQPAGALPILAQTPAYVVLDKPAGMPSHRLRPTDPPAALDSVMLQWPQVATAGPDPREGGLLHRLDVGTSGALAFALNPQAYEDGRTAFKVGTARKLYLALCHGTLAPTGVVDVPVAHDPGDPRRSVTVPAQDSRHRGKPRQALTAWRVLCSQGQDHLVLLDGRGGRRHQVRVHMAHLGAPLWGDDLYGGPSWPSGGPALPAHALHAVWLEFDGVNQHVTALAPAPAAFANATQALLGPPGAQALALGTKPPFDI